MQGQDNTEQGGNDILSKGEEHKQTQQEVQRMVEDEASGNQGQEGDKYIVKDTSTKLGFFGRVNSKYEHIQVRGEKNVIRIVHSKDTLESVKDDAEHEHLIGGIRYAHRHKKATEPHDHAESEKRPDLSPHAKHLFKWIIILSSFLLVLGLTSFLLGPKFKDNKILYTISKIVTPSALFCGLSFSIVATMYIIIIWKLDNVLYINEESEKHLLSEEDTADDSDHNANGEAAESMGINTAFYRLCISHSLSAWGDRMWQFAVPVLMMYIFEDTLLPSALFALVQYLGVVILMPMAGLWVDREYRLKLIQVAITVENICIILTSITLGVMVSMNDTGSNKLIDVQIIIPFTILLILGVMGEVMNQVQTVSLENDWVVVITRDNNALLSKMNVILKRIDLLCKVLAPGVIGMFLGIYEDKKLSTIVGLLILALWNIVSWPIEYMMLYEVYHRTPRLHIKSIPDTDTYFRRLLQKNPDEGKREKEFGVLDSIRAYVGHPVFGASFAACLLYMTVLDNGALITSYLTWRQMPASVLGAQRGFGALVGLIGTFVFMHLVTIGKDVNKIGLVSIWLFLLTIVPSVIIMLLQGETKFSDYALIAAMISSRAFLWMFDLAQRQIMQEMIEESSRGILNSMQVATYQILYCVIQVFGMVFHDPGQFFYLAAISAGSLSFAALVFTIWYFRPKLSSRGYAIIEDL